MCFLKTQPQPQLVYSYLFWRAEDLYVCIVSVAVAGHSPQTHRIYITCRFRSSKTRHTLVSARYRRGGPIAKVRKYTLSAQVFTVLQHVIHMSVLVGFESWPQYCVRYYAGESCMSCTLEVLGRISCLFCAGGRRMR